MTGKADDIYESFERCHKSSSKGDVGALLDLGSMYMNGSVFKEDPNAAFECFSKAAETGDPEAEYELGICYYFGIGVEANRTKGYSLILDASEKGNHDAMGFLGYMYLRNDGETRNVEKGIELLTRSSEMGCISAMEDLAVEYQFGIHVKKDDDMFMALIRSGAAQGSPFSKYMLGSEYMDSGDEKLRKKGLEMIVSASDDGIVLATLEYMSFCEKTGKRFEATRRAKMVLRQTDDAPFLIRAAQAMIRIRGRKGYTDDAFELLEKAAKKDDPEAYYELGCLYLNSANSRYDSTKAFECFKKAADSGYVPAFKYVGTGYRLGRGVARDMSQAEAWYFRGDAENDGNCQLELAYMVAFGLVRRIDPKKAMDIAKKAFGNGIVAAAYTLGSWYETWEAVRSIPDSIYWYRKGAEAGEPRCIEELAKHYMSGTYVKENPGKAFELYTQLSRNKENGDIGHAELGRFYEEGIFVRKDVRKARMHYMEAIRNRNPLAAYRLHELAGRSGYSDEMIFWLMSSAAAGSVTAMMDLAARYENGDGVPRSYSQALEWYHRAADKGNEYAKENLSQMLLMDEFEEEPTPYFDIIYQAAVNGRADFMTLYRARLEGTMGVRKSKRQAMRWFSIGRFLFPNTFTESCLAECEDTDGTEGM